MAMTEGIREKDQTTEEPDEAKVSRPILKTSRVGDCSAEFNNGQCCVAS
jgi:dTMP kinase